MLVLKALNIFGRALQPLLAVEERWGSCIQDSSKGAKDSRCFAIKARKKESVSEEAATDPKSLERKAWEGASDPKSVEKFGTVL